MSDGESGFQDEFELVSRAQDGSPAARRDLYERHANIVVGTLNLRLKEQWGECERILQSTRGSDAETLSPLQLLAIEIAGETYMPALSTYDPAYGTLFSTWWLTKAGWTLEQWKRDSHRLARFELGHDVDEAADTNRSPADEAEANDERRRVKEVLDELTTEEQQALWLVLVVHADSVNPLQRAADELGVPFTRLRNTLRRGRRHFVEAWIRRFGTWI